MHTRFLSCWLQFFLLFVISSILIGVLVRTYTIPHGDDGSEQIKYMSIAIAIALEALLSLFLCYLFFFRRSWESPPPPSKLPREHPDGTK